MAPELGVIGGLSPYSTILYYKFLVEEYRRRRGRDPRLVIYSLPVQEMCRTAGRGDFEGASRLIEEAAEAIARAGARVAILAANTPHWVLRRMPEERLRGLRFIDIVEPVAARLKSLGVRRVGLLATASTVEKRVYHDVLEPEGIEVVVPGPAGQRRLDDLVSRVVEGSMSEGDRLTLAGLVSELVGKGAEAIVYGCTELSLYVGSIRFRVPVVDSLTEHVRAAVDAITGGGVAEAD